MEREDKIEHQLAYANTFGDRDTVPKHLLLAVHGIGKHDFDKRQNIEMIEWHSLVRKLAAAHKLVQMTTLKTVQPLRKFVNSTLLDIMYYMNPVIGAAIRNVVAQELNKAYEEFMERYPTFSGTVSILGHSLGTVVMWDILQGGNVPLKFDVEMLVNMGQVENKMVAYPTHRSPLGMFLGVKGECIEKLPDIKKLVNIMHPADPVAYRLEPLINECLENIPPVVMKHHKHDGTRLHTLVQKRMKERTSKTISALANFSERVTGKNADALRQWQPEVGEKEENIVPLEWLERCPQGERVDFVLQETLVEVGPTGYAMGVKTHKGYWHHPDVAMFLANLYVDDEEDFVVVSKEIE